MTDKKKILVIDDEQFSLKTVQACMRGTNYALTLCLDPQEADSKFKAEQYDVIITDINMNGINGFDLRGLIRNSNKLIPIIFMSSLADNMDSTLMKQITSDRYSYYMNKSFKKMDLLMMIERVLEVPNAQQEIAALKSSIDKDLKLAGQIQNFGRDFLLTALVVLQREFCKKVLGIVACRLHCNCAGGIFSCR